MKLPSIQYLKHHAQIAIKRFPFVILSSFIAVCMGIYLVEYGEELKNHLPHINLLLSFALGIPTFFCIALFSEKRPFLIKVALFTGNVILLTAIYFYLPDHEETNNFSVPYIRYGLYNVIAHLLVSFIPYSGKGKLNGFWNYNKGLFIRFLASVLYSTFLYIGLTIALTALDLLFDIDLHDELYFEFFIVIAGFFNTWFFVAGIPENLDELDSIYVYPKGLKIFVQYILLPLLVLYLLILYVYGGKILVTGNWPKGIVSYLIAIISPLGILTLLLIYPYGKQKGSEWIRKFTHGYYFILVPLIVLLFIAIGLRIGEYGITINRYGVLLLGIWLSIVSISGILRNQNIKFIPISLSLLLTLISFGPWGIFAVSESSQSNRLLAILENKQLIENGKILNESIWEKDSLPKLYTESTFLNDNHLNDSLKGEIQSILEYLDDFHGFSKLQPIFQQNIDSLIKNTLKNEKYVNETEIYMKSMGLNYFFRNPTFQNNYFSFFAKQEEVKYITGYDYLIPIKMHEFKEGEDSSIYVFKTDTLQLDVSIPKNAISPIKISIETDTLVFDLLSLAERLKSSYSQQGNQIPAQEMTLYSSSEKLKVRLNFSTLGFRETKDRSWIQNLDAELYLGYQD